MYPTLDKIEKTSIYKRFFKSFTKGNSNLCPLCLKVWFNLLGKSSLSALVSNKPNTNILTDIMQNIHSQIQNFITNQTKQTTQITQPPTKHSPQHIQQSHHSKIFEI